MKKTEIYILAAWMLFMGTLANAQEAPGISSNASQSPGAGVQMQPGMQPVVDAAALYETVGTYVNPVLPGDHPDPTLLKVGDDFYHCGSSFHFTPYLPIYHSRDLVHWEVISRVVTPAVADFVTDRPSGGIWQGAITYFYGSYWIYFSANGQWFSKASSPEGPWSTPVAVKSNPVTGPLGYDNSVFVDDDGKPYMLIKNGQHTNRIQALGRDGQLTDTVINLDWVNAKLQYSWAEGPVMCKRNGFYFYFPAGDVTGGQFVLRTKELTSDSTKWERLGNFFKPITDPKAPFRSPNHIAAPLQLADGTWWTIGQSYERLPGADWSGMGRQTSLYRVVWEGDRPWGVAPTSMPVVKPNLPKSNIHWRSVHSDHFDSDSLGMWWHFLNRKAANAWSLGERKGWLRLNGNGARSHVLQKETDHFYSAVTRVDLNAVKTGEKAGIFLTNGNQTVIVRLYTGFSEGKKIIFEMDTAKRMVANDVGKTVWLKLERNEHELSAYCSADGKKWISLGAPVSAVILDKAQPNFNSWVGTSLGLFAENASADFDCFICKDGFSSLPAAGYSNYYGVEIKETANGKLVTNTTPNGGWFMISGVDLGDEDWSASKISINALAKRKAKLEIWIDDLAGGKHIATVTIGGTADRVRTVTKKIKNFSGHHDVFVKFPNGSANELFIESVQFLRNR